MTLFSCSPQFSQIVKASYQDVVDSHNYRYGTGSMNDATKYPDLAPWLSQINKMADSGTISIQERDKRKSDLIQSYNEYNSGKISATEYQRRKQSLTR